MCLLSAVWCIAYDYCGLAFEFQVHAWHMWFLPSIFAAGIIILDYLSPFSFAR